MASRSQTVDSVADAIEPPPDYTGQDARDQDFTGADLREGRFVGADLRGCSFRGADLTGAKLVGALLNDADLTDCHASNAVFGQADLSGANLFGADLSNASFSSATLYGADLRAANLDHARFIESDLTKADLSGAVVSNGDLTGATVTETRFTNTNLNNSSLSRLTGFAKADWVGVSVANNDFAGAYLVRREIMDQNYLFEFRTRDRRHAALYAIWKATSDCGRSLARWGAMTAAVAVLFGVLFTLVHIDYGPNQTPLSPFYFSVVTITTLGYGDALPKSITAQSLVMLEVAVGYMMLGGVLSIFATRMGRRAD